MTHSTPYYCSWFYYCHEDGGTMFTETSVHLSHNIRHHIPEDTVSTVSTSNLTTYSSTPKSVSYCQPFSIIHKVPGCCHVAACCRHSARNNTAVLPHPAACNLITPLLRLSSRNVKPCAKFQVETSVRAAVALLRSSPPPYLSPHPAESVKQYTSTNSVKPSGYRTYRSLSH